MRDRCDCCGEKLRGGVAMGGALLCRRCAADLRAEADRLHAEGKPVSIIKMARERFRANHSAGAYQLRDIPEDLWTRAKHRAVDEGISLRELILRAMEMYLGRR